MFSRQIEQFIDVAERICEGSAQAYRYSRLYVWPGKYILPGRLVKAAKRHGVNLSHHTVVPFDRLGTDTVCE